MTDKEFDNGIKEKLSFYTEEVPDLWSDIEVTLVRKRRWKVVRNASYAIAAAAACLVAGFFLFDGGDADIPAKEYTQFAQAQEEILPVEEQLKEFNISGALASVPRETVNNISEQLVMEQAAAEDEPVPVNVTENEKRIVNSEKTQDTDHLLTSEDIPESFWEEEDESSTRHTSQISILTNLSASSDKAMSRIYNGSTPMHSASQSGKSNSVSGVSPLSGTERFDLPLAFGLQFKTKIYKHFYAGAGVNMTYLVSQYDALINSAREKGVYNQLWYVGIPVNLYWNFVESQNLGVYATLGGAVEKCIYQRYVFGNKALHESVDGFQYSIAAGMGVEYWFAPKLGLYLDPSLVYYFDNSQPLSIRTQQPLQVRMEVGFRFKL